MKAHTPVPGGRLSPRCTGLKSGAKPRLVRLRPFAAIRPRPNVATRVVCPPYDVVTAEEARRLAAGNAESFLHVIRAEIDLINDIDPYDTAVYEKARENFNRLLNEGILLREATPKMYLYRLVMDGGSQTGLVCCCHIDDYANNVIRRHEKTRPDKEDDRTRLMQAVGAQTGAVFLTFRDRPEIDPIVQQDLNARPLYHFDAPDGVTHTVWTARDPDRYCEIFAATEAVYVADGHHRAASALRAGLERRKSNPHHTGGEEYNWFLAALFPTGQVTILPYHRLIKDLGGQTQGEFLSKLARVGRLSRTTDPRPDRPSVFCVYLPGAWHRLQLAQDGATETDDALGSLDVALLQNRVLGPILGVTDPRSDPRIEFVGGMKGTQELQRRVNSGQAAVAFAVYPTSIDQLLSVADAGLVMPPKSTWFEPKLLSGLFVHSIEDR
ncbi:MAG: DUF1015 domain-containing protein [Planctomycetes bacterium]|nr:DUF1015 domain-containing protein [Planctomycetota bacterium]